MSREFRQGLFGCFGDFRVCIITWFVPCYTEGKIAEKVGEDCLMQGLVVMVPLLNIFCLWKIREKVRTQKNIEGSAVSDILSVCCCMECALCQEAVEVDALSSGQPIAR
ncbi:hypothetical protein HELRODRAFT_185980 [Helobdella robusta]|uniref:Uncharacterized protein n=1 Tax=Helobdella robusta TaxID=6412 RepID=T1FNI4_HELRO|nr:hypothetical protein HELRODRAFT_185980 [Helobdella robusta]ESN95345.1 hypothetical protein HELRODRAFT_185980 [Helobdella robusta]